MKKHFIPDYIFGEFSEITPDFLKKLNINALICDIDNTLATYEQEDPSEDVVKWCMEMEKNGIKISFASNNNKKRVERFNRSFGYPAYFNSAKPSRKALFSAIEEMGSSPAATAVIGDQILTDVLAAKRAGLTAIIVNPIKDKNTLFFKIKRMIEKPFLKEYARINEEKRKEKS